jgi:hypothetical protein
VFVSDTAPICSIVQANMCKVIGKEVAVELTCEGNRAKEWRDRERRRRKRWSERTRRIAEKSVVLRLKEETLQSEN